MSEYLAKGDFVYRSKRHLSVVTARNSMLTTVDGRQILDLEAANGAALLGYDQSILESAVARASRIPAAPSVVETDLREEVADSLGELLYRETGRTGRLSFELGGAQGIELALKIAAVGSRIDRVFVLDGAYHGRSLFTATLSASNRYRASVPAGGCEVVRLPVPNLIERVGYTARESRDFCTRYIQRLFCDEAFGLAGRHGHLGRSIFLFEPVLNVAGLIPVCADYLGLIADTIHAAGGYVIADEVFTGLYRYGRVLRTDLEKVDADIIVLSKILTNGIAPLSCCWTLRGLADPNRFAPGTHSSTFSNYPFGFALAAEVLSRLKELTSSQFETTQGHLRVIEKALELQLPSGAQSSEVSGLTLRLHANEPDEAAALKEALTQLTHGVLVAITGMAPDTLCIHPAITLNDSEMRHFDRALDELSTT